MLKLSPWCEEGNREAGATCQELMAPGGWEEGTDRAGGAMSGNVSWRAGFLRGMDYCSGCFFYR